MNTADKTAVIKSLAADMGFRRTGIAQAQPIERSDYLERWLAAGRAGTMQYLHRNHEIRTDPRNLLPGARSVIVVAANYHLPEPEACGSDQPTGRIAMYAWGEDYHRTVKRRLHALTDALRERIPDPFDARCCVDTVPLLERELAAAAGVGWIGKNTMVLDAECGSYFFLGEIVTTLDLLYDDPAVDRCGSCTKCLDACPTAAFPQPYEMDASRCISYLTIEHRGDIAEPFHEGMDDWVFGCDVCQQVCPFNRKAPYADDVTPTSHGPRLNIDEVAGWSESEYREAMRRSAVKRATPEMLKRNAAIASANLKRRRLDGRATTDG